MRRVLNFDMDTFIFIKVLLSKLRNPKYGCSNMLHAAGQRGVGNFLELNAGSKLTI